MKPCKKEESHPSAPAKGRRSHGDPDCQYYPGRRQQHRSTAPATGPAPNGRLSPRERGSRAGRGARAIAAVRCSPAAARDGRLHAAPVSPLPSTPPPAPFPADTARAPLQRSPSPAHAPRRPHFQRGVIHAWAPAQPPGPWSMAAACCSAAASGVGFFSPWSIIMLAIRGVWIRRDPF